MIAELSHLIGFNAAIIARLINLIILLTFPAIFLVMVGVVIYTLVTVNKLKQRVEKIEEEINQNKT